jgi:hypothetical protein
MGHCKVASPDSGLTGTHVVVTQRTDHSFWLMQKVEQHGIRVISLYLAKTEY